MADGTYTKAYLIARRQFAVQPKIKKRKLPRAVAQLKSYSDGQMSLSFNGAFWPTILPFFQGTWAALSTASCIRIYEFRHCQSGRV